MFKKISLSLVAFVLFVAAELPAGIFWCGDCCFGESCYDSCCDFTWTGFYVGANGGVNWARAKHREEITGAQFRNSITGGLAGGHFGYNLQDCNNIVYSIEASFDWTSLKRTRSTVIGVNPSFPISFRNKMDWFGTITPRIGYAFCNWLVYLKGGVAYASIDSSLSVSTVGNIERKSTLWGGTFGVGVDYAWDCHWTVGVEYDYFSFGKRNLNGSFTLPSQAVATPININDKVRYEGGAVVFRLGYLF